MATQRIFWVNLEEGVTGVSIPIDDESLRIREYSWHAFVSGTFGANSSTVQIEFSPDNPAIADASSNWYSPTTLLFTVAGNLFFQAKPRKFRPVLSGGDGTTLINVEIR